MPPRAETHPIRTSDDVVRVRQVARAFANELRLSLVDQTKLVTATSELARNTLEHGGGGEMHIEFVENGVKRGVRLSFSDHGKGIPDIALALRDGYTTGAGMGLGLSGSKRLVSEFDIQSTPGEGTIVTIVRWK